MVTTQWVREGGAAPTGVFQFHLPKTGFKIVFVVHTVIP